MIQISTYQTASSHYTFSIILEQKVFDLTFFWNERSQNWYFSIENKEDSTKLTNRKLVENWALLRNHKALFRSLEGDFILLRLSNSSSEVELSYDNFGSSFILYFLSSAELASWEVANGF